LRRHGGKVSENRGDSHNDGGDSETSGATGIEARARPDLPETFADSINQVFFDGQTLRINFGVTRVDPPAQPQTARRYPACRLVLTPGAAVELMNQIQRLTAGMIQAGVLKAAAAPAHPAAATPPSADRKMN
jgi:hypothetical protein